MNHYTMTIAEMINNPLTPIFDDDFAFYVKDKKLKEEFKEKFYGRYYLNEIAFETPYTFKFMLNHRLKEIMPYYEQLYQTEWKRVNKDMMNQKDLVDTITHTLKSSSSGDNQTNSTGKTNQSNQSTSSLNINGSEQSNEQVTSQHEESFIRDGVSSATIDSNYLTGKSKDESGNTISRSNSSKQSYSGNDSSKIDDSQQLNSSSNQQTILEETTTTISHGDVGIQTPAYAISEWRKIIINIDKLILDELSDLFLKIY